MSKSNGSNIDIEDTEAFYNWEQVNSKNSLPYYPFFIKTDLIYEIITS